MNKVRFWIYWKGLARITLTEGNPIELYDARPTDEGYSYELEKFELSGDMVHRESASGGRDCDGPIDYCTEYVCQLDQLSSGREVSSQNSTIKMPNWSKERSEVIDVFARSMGY